MPDLSPREDCLLGEDPVDQDVGRQHQQDRQRGCGATCWSRQTFPVNAVLTTLVGGLLAIAGGLVGIAMGDRRERSRWLRDTQLQACTNLLSALQLLIRRMITWHTSIQKITLHPRPQPSAKQPWHGTTLSMAHS